MRREGPPWADGLEAWAESRAVAIRAACKDVARDVRGLPQDEAERRLTDALRHRGLFCPPSEIRLLAWQMTDPWRSLKHPLRTYQEARRIMDQPDSADDRAAQAEVSEVISRIDDILDALDPGDCPSWKFTSEHTFDGPRYEVVLDPYSEHIAAQIREALAPIPITIKPGES